MAFNNKTLGVLAYANGFTLWSYVSDDSLYQTCRTGYFNNVKTLLNVGDLIIINTKTQHGVRVVITSGDHGVTLARLD